MDEKEKRYCQNTFNIRDVDLNELDIELLSNELEKNFSDYEKQKREKKEPSGNEDMNESDNCRVGAEDKQTEPGKTELSVNKRLDRLESSLLDLASKVDSLSDETKFSNEDLFNYEDDELPEKSSDLDKWFTYVGFAIMLAPAICCLASYICKCLDGFSTANFCIAVGLAFIFTGTCKKIWQCLDE